MIDLNNKLKFGKLAKECKTDIQKINFFNTYQEAFVPNKIERTFSFKKNVSKEIDDAFYVYANMKRMTEDELDELRELPWEKYPVNFKIFLFDFCFMNTNWVNFNLLILNAVDMIPILATSTKANLLIYVVGGGGFTFLGSFFFGRLVTFFFPKNPWSENLERNNHERLSALKLVKRLRGSNPSRMTSKGHAKQP